MEMWAIFLGGAFDGTRTKVNRFDDRMMFKMPPSTSIDTVDLIGRGYTTITEVKVQYYRWVRESSINIQGMRYGIYAYLPPETMRDKEEYPGAV
jgi:hypothetical protein